MGVTGHPHQERRKRGRCEDDDQDKSRATTDAGDADGASGPDSGGRSGSARCLIGWINSALTLSRSVSAERRRVRYSWWPP